MTQKNFLISLLIAAAAPAFATSFIALPLPETTQQTPVMVRGRAGSSYSDWGKGADGTKRIYTYYDFQVTEVFKGDVKDNSGILIREMGGEKDGVGMEVSGAAHFNKGEDAIVTLSGRNADGSYDVRGLSSGKYLIRQDQSGNEYLVGMIADEEPAPGETPSEPPKKHRWTLDELRKLIAAQAANPTSTPVQNSVTALPKSSITASPTVRPTAPQLQPVHTQGAAESQENSTRKSPAAYWIAAALLFGGLGIWFATRK